MCKPTSIHVPILVADEPHEIARNAENQERERENSDRRSIIVIILCATVLTFYILLGMPCGCSYPTTGGIPSNSLRGAAFMLTIADTAVEDSDEHHQTLHRRPDSLVQFLLDADAWHQLSSSDANDSEESYSSDSDSSDNEQEEWLEIQEDDDVDNSEENVVNFLPKPLQSEIEAPTSNIDKSLSTDQVDSSLPSEDLAGSSYD